VPALAPLIVGIAVFSATTLYWVAPAALVLVAPVLLFILHDWRQWPSDLRLRKQGGWWLTTLNGRVFEFDDIVARLLPGGFCLLQGSGPKRAPAFLVAPWQCGADERALLLGLARCHASGSST
jgi:hypothetical protein